MSPDLIDQFTFAHRVHVEAKDLQKLPPRLQGTLRVANEQFFRGRDVHYPSIGDVRVHFSGIAAVNVTIIAQLKVSLGTGPSQPCAPAQNHFLALMPCVQGRELVTCTGGAIVEGQKEGQHRVENAFVRPGLLSMSEMRTAFAATVVRAAARTQARRAVDPCEQ